GRWRPRSRQPSEADASINVSTLRPRRAPLATHVARARLRQRAVEASRVGGHDARHREDSRARINPQPPAQAHALRALHLETTPEPRRAPRLLLRSARRATHTH